MPPKKQKQKKQKKT